MSYFAFKSLSVMINFETEDQMDTLFPPLLLDLPLDLFVPALVQQQQPK